MIYETISDLNQLLSGLPATALLEIDTGSASYSVTVAQILAAQGQLQLTNNDVEAFTPGMILTIPTAGNAQVAIPNGTFAQALASGVALGIQPTAGVGGVATYGYVSGFVGLTPGLLWLGHNGGIICSPNPPNIHGEYNVPLGRVISATEIVFAPGIPTLYR